jgi:prevent-host-death family protein
MKVANIGEFKNNLSKFIGFVKQREVVKICKHNVPVAKLIPYGSEKTGNYTQL